MKTKTIKMRAAEQPRRVINSAAPIRICDFGGWTDTWFARHGCILNIGVYPYAEVQIEVRHWDGDGDRVVINAENFGERYALRRVRKTGWDRHPLLEAAIAYMHIPDDLAFEVTIFSEAPSGASTGTSSAVTVAMVGALDQLTPGRLSPHEVAYAAQAIETELLQQQCGIQDQLCAAFGGINYIDMHAYPRATVSPIVIPNAVWWELERRLMLVYLGNTHNSSQVHEKVIRELEDAGPEVPALRELRATAPKARDALYAGDFDTLGRTMIENHEAQRRLNPALISRAADEIVAIAREHGAIGWKVNGAGGDGGSLTLLSGSLSTHKRAAIRAIEAANPHFRNIPLYLSRFGLRVWEQHDVAPVHRAHA